MKLSSFTLLFILGCSSLAIAGDGSACDKTFSFLASSSPSNDDDVTDHIYAGFHRTQFQGWGRCDYTASKSVCPVNAKANPSVAFTESGPVKRTGFKHDGWAGGTYGSTSGTSPQEATTQMVGGWVGCLGGCGDESVVGGPPWYISPDQWFHYAQTYWTNRCPKEDIRDNQCIKVQDKSTHGWKCCDPNCGTPVAIGVPGQDWKKVFGGPADDDCVWFDILATGKKVCVDWPLADSNVGWLASPIKDKHGKWVILDGTQLYGSRTPQQRNVRISDGVALEGDGYAAMSEKDKPENGGNSDWKLSGKELEGMCVWYDRNRNGKLDAGECMPLPKVGSGIFSLSVVADHEMIEDDRHNQCRLTATINDDPGWMSYDCYMQIRKR